jgi:hypothetical protein
VTIRAEAGNAAVRVTCSDKTVDRKDVVDPRAYPGEFIDIAFRVEVVDPRICPLTAKQVVRNRQTAVWRKNEKSPQPPMLRDP